jgi:hypothetical protein
MQKEGWNIATKPRSVVALWRAEMSDPEDRNLVRRLDMEHGFVPCFETSFDGYATING